MQDYMQRSFSLEKPTTELNDPHTGFYFAILEANPIGYKKKGFIEFDKHLFKLGNDVQTDIMMKINLTL